MSVLIDIYQQVQTWLQHFPDYQSWYWALLLPYTLFGGWIYHVRGGWFPRDYLTRPGVLILWSLGLCLPIFMLLPLWAALISFSFVILATSMGHGDGIDFGHSPRRDPDEWISRLIRLVVQQLNLKFPKDGYAHDTVYMALSGLSMTIIPGIFLILYGHSLFGAAFILSGLFKAPGYYLSWSIFDKLGYNSNWLIPAGVPLAETLTGLFINFSVGITYLLYIM